MKIELEQVGCRPTLPVGFMGHDECNTNFAFYDGVTDSAVYIGANQDPKTQGYPAIAVTGKAELVASLIRTAWQQFDFSQDIDDPCTPPMRVTLDTEPKQVTPTMWVHHCSIHLISV
jgi:hypothetical protein